VDSGANQCRLILFQPLSSSPRSRRSIEVDDGEAGSCAGWHANEGVWAGCPPSSDLRLVLRGVFESVFGERAFGPERTPFLVCFIVPPAWENWVLLGKVKHTLNRHHGCQFWFHINPQLNNCTSK
jgi:hypothetical protein